MELMETTTEVAQPAPPPPHTVRIKRKRNQDPLQALGSKKRKTSGYVFKLAATYENDQGFDQEALLRVEDPAQKVFRLAKKRKNADVSHEDPVVAQSLSEMVQSYLDEHPEKDDSTRGPSLPTAEKSADSVPDADVEVEDYVYDIYYRERYQGPLDATSPSIGLLVFDSDEADLVIEDEADSNIDTADEDSNAEDFYKNDYPEEEDGVYWSDEDPDPRTALHEQQARMERREQREGRQYLGIGENPDDDSGNELSSEDGADLHSPQWSEDEDYEQYRDRVWGQMEQRLGR